LTFRSAGFQPAPRLCRGALWRVLAARAVMTAVLSFNLLGDAWRDWLDPSTRAQLEVAHLSR